MNQEPTVHLADDDDDDRMLIKDALKEANPDVNVVEAQNGLELVENVKKSDDLTDTVVVVDMNMPKMNGIEAIKEMRSEPTLLDVPTVMLSTSNNPDLRKKALDAGADAYFVKPNTFRALFDLMKGILKKFLR